MPMGYVKRAVLLLAFGAIGAIRGPRPTCRSMSDNQCLTTIGSGWPIDTDRAPRGHGNATEFKTYYAIGVTPTPTTVRARTLALEVRNAAGAVISPKCLALWRNWRKNASLAACAPEPVSRPTHGAPPSRAYIRDVSRVGAQRRFAGARTPLASRAVPAA